MDRKASFITAVALLSIGSFAGAASLPGDQPEKPKAEARVSASAPASDAAAPVKTNPTLDAAAKPGEKPSSVAEKPAAKPMDKTSSAADKTAPGEAKPATAGAQDLAKTGTAKPATAGQPAAEKSAATGPTTGKDGGHGTAQPLHPTSGTAPEKPAKEKL